MTTSNFLNRSLIRSGGLTIRANNVKTNTLAFLFIILASFLFIGSAKAQVTIGSGIAPEGGAVLDMKEFAAGSTNNETANKGVVLPRVILTDKNELYPMYSVPTNTATKKSHTGMTVYNVTTSTPGDFANGVHTWTGTEWRKIDDSPVIQPEITNLICGSAQMTPNTYTSGTPFEGILKVPYLGGNGGAYDGAPPFSIGNDLSIERIGGKLAYGGGEVMYRVFGTPTVSSPIVTSISSINFLSFTCNGIDIGNGLTGINLRTLSTQTAINITYDENALATLSNELPFGTITISESGSYAFSFRLYGEIPVANSGKIERFPFYIFLSKNNKSFMSNLVDAAEIDIVVPYTTDYSYSVTLGGAFEAGDQVIVSMAKPKWGPWTLKTNSNTASPIRTSLIYWKL